MEKNDLQYPVQDENLSWQALGLLAYLISLGDDQQWTIPELAKAKSPAKATSKDTIYKLINELISLGYVARRRRFGGGIEYYTYADPSQNPFFSNKGE